MKVIRAAFVLLAAFAFVSCASLARDALSSALSGAIGGAAPSASSPASVQAVADFLSGEILCSTDEGSMTETYYRVGRIVTPANAATKNQAEVIFISDGAKAWVNYVVGSRKATKGDIEIGAPVFYLNGWSGSDRSRPLRSVSLYLASILSL